MQNLKVTLIQTEQFWEDKTKNLRHFEQHLNTVPKDTSIVVLPEMFHTGFSMNSEELAETMNEEGLNWLKKQAEKHGAAFVASIIIEENNKFYNRMVFVTPEAEVYSYDKRKLFGLGKEDQHYSPGTSNTIVNYKHWKILLQVCYDLRFPEISRNKIDEDGYPLYDAIIYVANWPKKRSSHWRALLQARAIENQCYVVAVNRVGTDANNLDYSGDSCVINPLGEILDHKQDVECVFSEELDRKLVDEVRENLPFLKDT